MPTAQQQQNAANPTAFTVNLPGEGQVFKDPTNGGIYQWKGGKLYNISLDTLGKMTYAPDTYNAAAGTFSSAGTPFGAGGKYSGRGGDTQAGIDALKEKYGIDYYSLSNSSYNIADLQQQGGGMQQLDPNSLLSGLSGPVGASSTKTVNGPDVGADVSRQLANLTPNAPGQTTQPTNTTQGPLYNAQATNQGPNAMANTPSGILAGGPPISPATVNNMLPPVNLPGTVNSNNLNSTGSLNYQIPTNSNSASTIMGGLTSSYQQSLNPPLGPQDQQMSDLTKSIMALNTQDAGRADYQQQENDAFGVTEKTKAVTDLQANLQQILNEHAAAQLQDQQGQGVTSAVDQRQRDFETRQSAIKALSINSLIAAAQGNLTSAQALADKAVAQKFDPIEAQIKAQIANLNLLKNDPKTTAEEKARADTIQAALDTYKEQLTQQRSVAADVGKIAVAAASYIQNFKPTNQFQTASQALQAIQNAPDAVTAQQIASSAGLMKDEAPKVLGSASTGYYSYDPSTGQTTPISGGSSGGTSTKGSSTNSKGQLSNKQFVELSLQRAGLKYEDALAKVPQGKVGVIDNATGQVGFIDPTEYNSKQYTYL